MRTLVPLAALLVCACPQPEDSFVISGQVVDLDGLPRPEVPVALRRARLASETRCESFDELRQTVTDTDGHFSFELLRQEAVAGVNARRFFAVEAPGVVEGTVTRRFWFPNADLELGPMGGRLQADPFSETRVDGHVAWRGGTLFLDRPSERRDVRAKRDWISVPIDSLGRVDVIPVETRIESPWLEQQPREGFVSTVIGSECPELPLSPCPLTDGRFLPYEFPPEVRQLLFNFKQEANVTNLLFHGLQLARPATKARLDFSFFVDFAELSPLVTRTLVPAQFERAQDTCDEPGAFLNIGSGGFIRPVVLRVRFEDAAGEVIPILSLQEVSAR